MTDEQGRPERDSTVDGPTAMTPTTGHFGGPPPASPTPTSPTPAPTAPAPAPAPAPDDPTLPAPAQTSVGGPTFYGATTGHHLAEPTTPPDEPTIADLAATYGPTTYGPTTGRHEAPAAAPPPASRPDEPTIAEPASNGPTGNHPTADHHSDRSATTPTHANAPAEPTNALDEEPTASHHHGSAIESTVAIPLDEASSAGLTGNSPTNSSHGSAIESTAAIPLDEPAAGLTSNGPTSGHHGSATESTAANPLDEPTADHHYAAPTTEPAHTNTIDDPTIAELTSNSSTTGQGPAIESTVAFPFDEPAADDQEPTPSAFAQFGEPGDDEPTAAVVTDDPTTTGPTVGGWPFDEFEPPPPGELVWQAEPPPPPDKPPTRSPAYYITLGAAVVLVVGLVALAAVVTVMRPRHEVAGVAVAAGASIPSITPSGQPPPPASTSTPAGPLSAVAAHPLSSSTTRMADTTCALPRFDPADDKQAAFYAAAKVCADNAWRGVLQQAGLDGAVTVVMVTGAVQTSCGDLAPTVAPTECDGTVYITPAYLRDTEQNGRYPGRYLGVFLREYARALQDATGLGELVGAVTTGSAADLDTRVDQQATCLAGVVSGAMAGRGAIDTNITGEIRARLTTVDAPRDAQAWLDKGFQQRTPAACNSWLN